MSALLPQSMRAERRVRHEVRDGLAVVAVSVGGSIAVAALLMLLVRLAG
ncbi:MAG: hypothetical protein HZY75_08550 [Nocardioidaceae bacterium]|nr:MAG: hypothetical protein HZY75_08550 [Nocardioidaceae bacterium]